MGRAVSPAAPDPAAPSALRAGLCGRCPRCGQGRLFAGILKVRAHCAACGLPLGQRQTADGPAYFVIVLVGVLIGTAGSLVEMAWHPPYWLHAALWVPLTLLLSVYFLRLFIAWMIAMQYRLHPESFR